MRWPRKNDAESIRSRREAMGLDGGLVTSVDLEPFAEAAESLVGVAVIPVSAVPGRDRARRVRADRRRRRRRDRARDGDRPRPARAHRRRAHRLDDPRRARSRRDSHVRARTTASRAPPASSAATRATRSRSPRWVEAELPTMRRFARAGRRPGALDAGAAPRRQDARRRPDVPRALAVDDRRRRRAEHDDAQLLRAEHGLRDAARAGQAGARDPRGEHGRRQEAVGRVLPVRARQDRARRGVPHRTSRSVACSARPPTDLEALSWAGTHGVGRERDAVGGVHARVGDRRGLRGDRPGSRHGRHELDGARHRRAASRAGCRRRSASAASRSAPSAAARPCRRRATGSRRSAAPARARSTASRRSSPPRRSALEISASAAMATAGSENFFKAHHERGGLR